MKTGGETAGLILDTFSRSYSDEFETSKLLGHFANNPDGYSGIVFPDRLLASSKSVVSSVLNARTQERDFASVCHMSNNCSEEDFLLFDSKKSQT